MIIIEQVVINGNTFKKTYSSLNLVIHKLGTQEYYDAAIDTLSSNYIYEETDTIIGQQEQE